MSEEQTYQDVEKAWGVTGSTELPGKKVYPKVDFFTLKDGETASLRFLDDVPYDVYQVGSFVSGKFRSAAVARENNVLVKSKGHRINKVNVVNVIDRRDGRRKLFQFTDARRMDIQIKMKRLKKCPTEFDLAVTRLVEKKKVRYAVDLDGNMEPLTATEKALTKVNLAEYYKPSLERLMPILETKPMHDDKVSQVTTTIESVNEVVTATNDESPL